jgi:hypothetical protein
MNYYTSPSFWKNYQLLPQVVQKSADKSFELLKKNYLHSSLHLKKIHNYWSVRVGIKHRALAIEIENGLLWFWIGTHAEYDKIIKSPLK